MNWIVPLNLLEGKNYVIQVLREENISLKKN